MKKYIYSLAILALGLTSCNSWDDPVTENYGDGPSISIDLQAIAPTDSAFNVTLTPAAGATYYAYIIDENDEAEDVDAATLLKGGYGNPVTDTSKNPTLTIPVTDANPNTTYQVYAVACNDKGIVGPVANKSIKTSDAGAPYPVDAEAEADAKTFYVQFSEDIAQGDGKIIVTCYKEWDITNPVELTDEEVEISVDGDVVTVKAPDSPDGAFLTLSWEEGAFVDGFGNKCAAFRSYLNLNTGDFIGLYVRNTTAPFEINDTNIVSPESGKIITDFEGFEGNIVMPFEIFRNDFELKDGAESVKVVYINSKKTTIHNLTPDQWSVNGKTLTFTLPVEPEDNDIIKVALAENAIYDVSGNGNMEFMADEVYWKYSLYKATKEDILGNHEYFVTLKSNGKTYDLGSFSISEYTDEDAEPGDVVIKDLYLEGSEMYGYYDLNLQKLYIWRYQPLGTYEEDGETYGVLTYSIGDNDLIEFDLTADGIISTDFALVYSDAEFSSLLGIEVPEGTTIFTKVAASSKAAKAKKKTATLKSKKNNVVKNLKGTPRKVKAIRKIRK